MKRKKITTGGIITVRHYFRIVAATAHRGFLENIRAYPWTFFIGRLFRGVFVIMTAYFIYSVLFKETTLDSFETFTGTADYMSYIVIGVIIQSYSNGAVLAVGRSLMTERRMGSLEGLFLAPIMHSAYFMGALLLHLVLTSVDVIIVIIVSVGFGIDMQSMNLTGLVVFVLIGHVGFFGMGIMLNVLMMYLRDTYLTQNTIILILYFICGTYFPTQYLPEVIQKVSKLIPLTYAIELSRGSALFGLGVAQQAHNVFKLLLISLVYCVLGYGLFKKTKTILLERPM